MAEIMLISTLLYLSIGRPRGGNHAELDVLVRAFAMSCRYSGSLGKCVTSMLEAGAEHSCLRYVTRYKVPALMTVGSGAAFAPSGVIRQRRQETIGQVEPINAQGSVVPRQVLLHPGLGAALELYSTVTLAGVALSQLSRPRAPCRQSRQSRQSSDTGS
jgi:hypothetical protein